MKKRGINAWHLTGKEQPKFSHPTATDSSIPLPRPSPNKPLTMTHHFGAEAGPIKTLASAEPRCGGPGMAAPAEPGEIEGYLGLRDVRVKLDLGKARGRGEEGAGAGAGGGFAVCFWLYLSGSARPSPVILHQVRLDSTHLVVPQF